MVNPSRALTSGLLTAALAVGLTACGATASTAKFKGESHNVAQTVSDLQSDVMANDQAKVCQNDLAGSVITKLGGSNGCESAIKSQLHEVDVPSMTIESIAVKGATATARVKSTWSGKSQVTTLSLVKEGSRWKISGSAG